MEKYELDFDGTNQEFAEKPWQKWKLVKLATREDALYPQKERYPDGSLLGIGRKLEEPTIGRPMLLYNTDYDVPVCWTSSVVGILEIKGDTVLFKTENSFYKLEKY